MRAAATLLVGGLMALAACELTEVTLTDTRDVVIVEGLVQVKNGPTVPQTEDRIAVFLHRTFDDGGASQAVPGATVRVGVVGGATRTLGEQPLEDCAVAIPDMGTGTCYTFVTGSGAIRPDDVVELRIDLMDGGVIEAATRVPGEFRLLIPSVDDCSMAPEQNFEIVWSLAENAWAYISETSISGLRDALAPKGIEVEHDPLNLLGLSISASDTTVVYPSELGLFSRTELDQDLALELQKGLPAGTNAEVAVAAVDRNFVNWARGGNFNPSGSVRVPSVTGDGTGVFASALVREFSVSVSEPPPTGTPECGPPHG